MLQHTYAIVRTSGVFYDVKREPSLASVSSADSVSSMESACAT
jgi:hypothetical protein